MTGGARLSGRTVIWLLTAALVLCLAAGAAAAEPAGEPAPPEPAPRTPDPDAVVLKADRGLRYDAETKEITAEGNVRLAYRNITLEADSVKVDLEHDLVRAEGNVRYRKDQDKIEAQSSVYDLQREGGTFYDVKTTYRGEDLKGDVYVVGSFMESSKDLLRLAKSNLTTCDLAQPHYHLEAEEITVYLGDRLVARRVTYFEGRRRLFTLPYLVVPLSKENQFELPRVGYSEQDGWFVKTTYNYYRSPSAFGAYFLDWYERQGLGLGLKHNYAFGPAAAKGSGWGYLYAKNHREPADRELWAGFDHQQRFSEGWKGTWRGLYEERYVTPTQRQEVAGATVQVTQQVPSGFTDLSAGYRRQETEYLAGSGGYPSDYHDLRVTFNTNQRLPNQWDWRFGASAARSAREGAAPYDNLGYQTQISRAFPDFTFRLSAQQQFNPPPVPEGEEKPPWNRYTRFPELMLESRTLTLRGRPLPLHFSASLSRFEEYSTRWPNGYVQTMGSLTGRLTGLTYPLTPKLSANLNGWGTATYYQNGEYTLGANAGAGVTYRPISPLAATVRFNWQDRLGSNPFTAIGVNPAQSVAGSVVYSARGLTADVGTSYDLLNDTFQDVVARLNLVRSRLSASGMVSYDPNTGTWRRASAIYAYQRDEQRMFKVGATVDLATSNLERLDTQVAAPLNRLWRAELTASYDGYTGQLTRGELALTRDLHCREVRLRYDEVRREIWAEFRIKALPYQVLRVGANEGALMFDAQSLGGLLGAGATNPGVPR